LDDFVLMEYEFPENRDIKIYPISDLHIGAKECMLTAWAAFVKRLKNEPDSYITIQGDMMNNAIKNSVSDIYRELMSPSKQKKWLAEQLNDVKNKILCVVPGNHEGRSQREVDDSPLYDVCCKLDIEDRFRENAAFVVIRIGDKAGNGQRNPTYTMVVQHGSGGGMLTGASVNRNERYGYAVDNMDILVVGHSHKPVLTKPQKIYIDPQNRKVSFKPFNVVQATSWLEYGGYALRKQLLPSSHALQEITLRGDRKSVRVSME
jgi:predicted phosphodiesterase